MSEVENKNISFTIPKTLHQQIKLHLALEDITLKDYIIGLINEDLNKNKNNK